MADAPGAERATIIEQARTQLFAGLVDTDTLSEIIKKSPQTIGRMIRKGILPYRRLAIAIIST